MPNTPSQASQLKIPQTVSRNLETYPAAQASMASTGALD
jgi:hypothetical protein